MQNGHVMQESLTKSKQSGHPFGPTIIRNGHAKKEAKKSVIWDQNYSSSKKSRHQHQNNRKLGSVSVNHHVNRIANDKRRVTLDTVNIEKISITDDAKSMTTGDANNNTNNSNNNNNNNNNNNKTMKLNPSTDKRPGTNCNINDNSNTNGSTSNGGRSESHSRSSSSSSDSNSSSSSSSSSSEEESDVAKACRKLQRQRSSVGVASGGLHDYRLLMQSIHSQPTHQRKLIIHVDIRNTILVADSITNVSVEEALNSFLTAVVWGKDKNGVWEWHSDVPSLKAPVAGLRTYYKFLERKLVKNQDDRVRLRLTTGDFVHTPRGQQFQKHFNVHLARLEWKYPHESMDKVLTMSGKDGRPYHYILPSFYKLLQYLTFNKREFAIVLRTYGRDADNVLSSLQYGTQGNHPAFRAPLNLPVLKKPGIINRWGNSFSLRSFKSSNHSETQHMLTHERDIYRHLSTSRGITGYVDDFCAWQNHNYYHKCGKPFWIDTSDTRHHHIFFDDNFRSDDEDSIIDVRLFSKDVPGPASSLNHVETQRFENACMVQADLLESIADESYFIRMVRMCENNYSLLLQEGRL